MFSVHHTYGNHVPVGPQGLGAACPPSFVPGVAAEQTDGVLVHQKESACHQGYCDSGRTPANPSPVPRTSLMPRKLH